MVFENCESSLYWLIHNPDLYPLPKRHTQEITKQIIQGLSCGYCRGVIASLTSLTFAITDLHSIGIAHTDLKPESIRLRRDDTVVYEDMDGTDWMSFRQGVRGIFPRIDLVLSFHLQEMLASTRIRIFDLECAVFTRRFRLTANGASHYKAPEMTIGTYTQIFRNAILKTRPGLQWDEKVDIFAAGCILAELFLGRSIFPASNNMVERLAVIERALGPYPPGFVIDTEEKFPGTFKLDKFRRLGCNKVVAFDVCRCLKSTANVMSVTPLAVCAAVTSYHVANAHFITGVDHRLHDTVPCQTSHESEQSYSSASRRRYETYILQTSHLRLKVASATSADLIDCVQR